MVKTRTRPSISISPIRGTLLGLSLTSADTHQCANNNPRPPPSAANKTLSVKSWRTTRDQLAPKANGTAISFCRARARASNKLATFAHTINITNPTIANNASNVSRLFRQRSARAARP